MGGKNKKRKDKSIDTEKVSVNCILTQTRFKINLTFLFKYIAQGKD